MLVLLLLLSLVSEGLVVLGQEISVLLEGRLAEDSLGPQVRGKVGVGLADSGIGSLGEVTQSTGAALSAGVAVINTSHLQQLLGYGGGDDASTAGGGDQTHPNGTALTGDLE